MVEFSIANARYTYLHDHKWPCQAIDVHHIVVRKSGAKGFFVYLSALLIFGNALYHVLSEEKSVTTLAWSFLVGAFLIKSFLWRSVEKESVVVMPAFGVQLETHYRSGRVIQRFVPIGDILKPVLNECVTPVTCYWSLSLILRGEEEVMLVFKELRPPVKMLVPIWKALCAATDDSITGTSMSTSTSTIGL